MSVAPTMQGDEKCMRTCRPREKGHCMIEVDISGSVGYISSSLSQEELKGPAWSERIQVENDACFSKLKLEMIDRSMQQLAEARDRYMHIYLARGQLLMHDDFLIGLAYILDP